MARYDDGENRNASPAMRRAQEELAAYEALSQNNISGNHEGITAAPAGTSIYEQLYTPTPQTYTSFDPEGGNAIHGNNTPVTTPSGGTVYSQQEVPATVAQSQAKSYGSEPLWLSQDGTPTYAFIDDNGQAMVRFPGWGAGSQYDPRWGEYVPAAAYKQWADEQHENKWISRLLPLAALAAVGAVTSPAWAGAVPAASYAGGAGTGAAAAGAGAAGTIMGPSGLLEAGFLGAEGAFGGAGAAAGAAGGAGALSTLGQASSALGAANTANSLLNEPDAGGDTMLNPFGGGGGDSLLGSGNNNSLWESIFGKALGPTFGKVLEGVLPSLLSAGGNAITMKQVEDALKEAQKAADPFASQRPFYQDTLKRMFTDPNFTQNDPTFQNILNPAMRGTESAMSARGYNDSGNMLHELQKTGQEQAAKYYLPMMSQVGGFAGAGFGPGQAGAIGAQNATQQGDFLKNIFGDLGMGAFNLMNGTNNNQQAPNIINGGSGGGPNLMSFLS